VCREIAGITPIPGKRSWAVDFPEWVKKLEIMIDSGVNRKTIVGGFIHSGIFPFNRDLIIQSLPSKCPSFIPLKVNKTSLFDIGNKVLTDPTFIQMWDDDMKQKQKGKKGMVKEEEITNEEENSQEEEEQSEHGLFFYLTSILIFRRRRKQHSFYYCSYLLQYIVPK
jgi:hypothetical protein